MPCSALSMFFFLFLSLMRAMLEILELLHPLHLHPDALLCSLNVLLPVLVVDESDAGDLGASLSVQLFCSLLDLTEFVRQLINKSIISSSNGIVNILLQLALVHGVVGGVEHELLLLFQHVVDLVVPHLPVHGQIDLLLPHLHLPHGWHHHPRSVQSL